MLRRALLALASVALILGVGTACSSDADTASRNLSTAADNFEIHRKIVFYNAILGVNVLEVEGRCSIGNNDEARFVSITCKVAKGEGADSFKKHHFFKSDNTVVFSEQVEGANVSAYHHRVTFKPQAVLPDVDFRGSTDDLPQSQD